MSEFSYTTKALYSGEKVCGMDLSPETIPCFLTTAFTMRGFKEVRIPMPTKVTPMYGPATQTAPLWER